MTFLPEIELDCRLTIMSLSSKRKSVQCSAEIPTWAVGGGETGAYELPALDPIEASDGVEVEVAEKVDGREEYDMPLEFGDADKGYSAGRSSTSIESIKSRLLLKSLAWDRQHRPYHSNLTYREALDIPLQAVEHRRAHGLRVRLAFCDPGRDFDRLEQFGTLGRERRHALEHCYESSDRFMTR